MDSKINQNLKNLNSLNKERIFWLRISLFVVVLSVTTIFNWNYLIKTDLIFLVASIGIIITVIWWYWTMSIIRKLIGFKTVETELMNDLVTDIKEIKQDIRKNLSKDS